MKKILKRIKNKPILLIIVIFFGLFLLSTTCLIYCILKIANIENLLRYLISAFLLLLFIYVLLHCYKTLLRGKIPMILLSSIVLIGIFVIESYACALINGFYISIDNIYKDTNTYSSSLIVMANDKANNIDNIKNYKIGIIDDINSIDGYKIGNEIMEEFNLNNSNEIVKYETIGEVIDALYNKKITAAFVTSTYTSMFVNNDTYKNIASETKIIYTKSKTVKKEESENKKETDSPLTILVLGIDSVQSDISKVTAFNADSLMLITFNPKTYNATILSIPRDTYVPIACLKNTPESKITHSGWYSETCVIKTIEEWTNIDIDYYVKINFTGVVNLVDAIGGIEVEVPFSFCEQNSKREWGNNTIYVEKGLRTINGEQALALSRNRHPNTECGAKWSNYSSSDIIRGQNQQLVIKSLINKITKDIDLDKVYSILDVIGKNIDTNISTNEILSYYNLAKKIALNTLNNNDIINFERLYLQTYSKSLYDPLTKLAGSSEEIYYKDSFKAIVDEMNLNLELTEPKLIKTFSFSVNEPYVLSMIGKGSFKQDDIETIPNFKNKDKSVAIAWAKEKGIKLNITYEEITEGTNDFVLKQNIPATYILANYDITKGLDIVVARVVKNSGNNSINNIDNNIVSNPAE